MGARVKDFQAISRSCVKKGRQCALTGPRRRLSPKLLQKDALGLRRILKAFGGLLLLLDLIRLILYRESVFDTWKCGQEERRLLQWLRGLFWFVPLLQESSPEECIRVNIKA